MLICLAALGSLGGTHFLYARFIDAWNDKQVGELTQRAITRAELAVDQAVITLGDLLAEGHFSCDPASLSIIRRAVFSTGAIKNIVVADHRGSCQAFDHAGFSDISEVLSAPRLVSRNPRISLFETRQDGKPGLGVSWSFEEGAEAAAILVTDSLLFDILPAELRDFGEVTLLLEGHRQVASYRPEISSIGGRREFDDIRQARSPRYPLISVLGLDRNVLAAWNQDVPIFVDIVAIAFAAVLGAVMGHLLMRPQSAEAELRKALRLGEIRPYFQPIISLGSNEIVGCELLARWIKRDGTMVSPAQFIPLAESSGLIDGVLEAVICGAGPQLTEMLAERPNLKLSFNVTPEQFLGAAFVTRLCELVHRAGLARARLVVEVTERQQITDFARARQVTSELREHGITVAIDDAGTGHNGLSSLQTLGAAYVKIDKLFVDAVATDHRTRTLVEMFVTVAREFGMMTVAEGIEQAEQLAVLKALGVQEGQGFLFSKPLPVEDFIDLLRKSNRGGKIVSLDGPRPLGSSPSGQSLVRSPDSRPLGAPEGPHIKCCS
ncbi:EAL domain-containing protein [Stappia albiluteola]|uniref:EAL domain-containing protein n=1 Tax=Stappia albiluteola TaxID=2758565 RepID=UPI002E2AB3C1|nr:EAL domain-containing protein [Stappia albiluteola]